MCYWRIYIIIIMAGMFAAMALAPIVSQLASIVLFGNQGGSGLRRGRLPGNSTMIGLPNHLPSNVYMSLRSLKDLNNKQKGSGRIRKKETCA